MSDCLPECEPDIEGEAMSNLTNRTENTMNIPSGLPTLSAGAHRPNEGKACVMEYIALLAGEAWTDSPSCTHRLLARAAQQVNDRLLDDDRHLLVPLIGRLFGTDVPVDDLVFALRIARTVEHSSSEAKACNDVTERFLSGNASKEELRDAYAATITAATYAPAAAAYAATTAYAAASATYAADRAAASAVATEAITYAAIKQTTSNGSNTVVTVPRSSASGLVAWLESIIDIYDELSGRTKHRTVSDQELAALAEAVTR